MTKRNVQWGQRSLTPARLAATRDGFVDAEFGDMYFSHTEPVAECDHVFVHGNELPARFAAWTAGRAFVLGETGFGSGLNILRAADWFLACAPPAARLHCVSVEGRPLQVADAMRLLDCAGISGECREALVAAWPEPVRGVRRIRLHPRITLDLHLNPVETALAGLDARVDAWFLDGFAPARNPEMWQQPIFDRIAALGCSRTTLATFTAAGWVRRGLTTAGFDCKQSDGFGLKRSMVTAKLSRTDTMPAGRSSPIWARQPLVETPPASVAVIGAGLAGTTVANALAERGVAVSVYDPAGVGGGASGNRQAATYIRLPAQPDHVGAFYLAALTHTLDWLERLDPGRSLWQDSGLLQLAASECEASRQRRVADRWALPDAVMQSVDRHTASALSGLDLGAEVRGGLYFARAGWIRAAALCEWLLARNGIDVQPDRVTDLRSTGSGWRLFFADRAAEAFDAVVVATAGDMSLVDLDRPELDSVRGQITEFDTAQPGKGDMPRCVVCSHSYVLPPFDDARLTIGATYAPGDPMSAPRACDDASNVAGLASAAPGLARRLGESRVAEHRVGWRAACSDLLPLIGPVPDQPRWLDAYGGLRWDAGKPLSSPPVYRSGLWLSTAHASRGAVSAPLAAEMLASAMCGEPMPVETSLADAVHPGRAIITALRRRRI